MKNERPMKFLSEFSGKSLSISETSERYFPNIYLKGFRVRLFTYYVDKRFYLV
jgi:hypothetical protein